jgi:hypothetical protein
MKRRAERLSLRVVDHQGALSVIDGPTRSLLGGGLQGNRDRTMRSAVLLGDQSTSSRALVWWKGSQHEDLERQATTNHTAYRRRSATF